MGHRVPVFGMSDAELLQRILMLQRRRWFLLGAGLVGGLVVVLAVVL